MNSFLTVKKHFSNCLKNSVIPVSYYYILHTNAKCTQLKGKLKLKWMIGKEKYLTLLIMKNEVPYFEAKIEFFSVIYIRYTSFQLQKFSRHSIRKLYVTFNFWTHFICHKVLGSFHNTLLHYWTLSSHLEHSRISKRA